MHTSIEEYLKDHMIDAITAEKLDADTDQDDWHNILFNSEYFVTYENEALEFLKEHDLGAFEAINTCIEYEQQNFGEVSMYKYTNAMQTVNMLMYVYGGELLGELNADTLDELREALDMEEDETEK